MAKASTDEKVMAMVEKELEKNPDVSVDELQKKGAGINKDVASLTARQFHARYPLQIKRRKAMADSGGTEKKKKAAPKRRARRSAGRRKARKAEKAAPAAQPAASGANREAVRTAFLRFASELTAAEQRKDLVKVLAGVDKYVDQAVEAATK